MEKRPFVTKEKLEEIAAKYPTPFHLYDEKGIRENARRMNKAFSWNKGFREYFAVKATPNPVLMKILKEEGCGVDCSSYTELMLSDACGFHGADIMLSLIHIFPCGGGTACIPAPRPRSVFRFRPRRPS